MSENGHPPAEDSTRRAVLAAAAIALIAFCVYLPALHGEFLNWDDEPYVVRNEAVQQLDASTVRWAFTEFHSFNWHPLTWLSHALDFALFGSSAWGHHLTSILLHALNSALLLWVLWRMTGSLGASVLVSALFALHPLQVESVAWIAERKNVLSTFFLLVALLAYAAYARRGGRLRYLAVAGAFVCGLLAKPMLVTLPAVLLLLDYWPLRRLSRRAIVEKIPLFLLSAVSSVITIVAQRSGGAALDMVQLGAGARVANAVHAYVRYLGKVFWPDDLVSYYPYLSGGAARSTWIVVVAALVLAVISIAAWCWRRRHPAFLVGWLWYLGTLVPVIGLVQVGGQAIADRYMYVPLIGLCIALVFGLHDRFQARSARAIVAVVSVLALAGLTGRTLVQIPIWRTSLGLWLHAESHYPESTIIQDGLGDAYRRKPDLGPDDAPELNRMGGIFFRRKILDSAEGFFRTSIRVQPNQAAAYGFLGAVRTRQERLDEAIELYRVALSYDPNHVGTLNNLGVALAQRGETADAMELWNRVLRVNPDDVSAHLNLARAAIMAGDTAGAAGHYEAVLRIQPGHRGAARALAELGGASP